MTNPSTYTNSAAWVPGDDIQGHAACSSTKPPPAEDPDEIRPGVQFGWDQEWYEVREEIGSGAAARVFACVRISTGEQLAVKVINLQRLALLGDFDGHMAMLDREVSILRGLHHERIVDLRHVQKTEKWYFLIMERVWGGELFHQIVQCKRFNEVEARYVFRQLLEGVAYMHSKHVIHRDLKPENILIASSRHADDGSQLRDVKIADFGLSKAIAEGVSMAKTFVGTPQYWAPEVLDVTRGGGSYDKAVDFWGLGTVLFVMLCGRYPFDKKEVPLEEQIATAAFNTSTARWGSVSPCAKDLVRGLLRVTPSERLCVEECLRHPWLTGGVPSSLDTVSEKALVASPTVSPREELPQKVDQKAPETAANNAGPARRRRRGGGARGQTQGDKVTLPAVVEADAPALHGQNGHAVNGSTVNGSTAHAIGDKTDARPWRPLWIFAAAVAVIAVVQHFAFVTDPSSTHARGNWTGGLVGALTTRAGGWRPTSVFPIGSEPTYAAGGRQESTVKATNSSTTWAVAGEEVMPVVGVDDACGEQETIFRLNELLKLQVSITVSLQMAVISFRHTDPALADSTLLTFRQAQLLFQHAADVISRYARIAAQVRENVLPDLQLAIQEMQPQLASSLLRMAKSWVAGMKVDGEEIQRRHNILEDSVLDLLRRAQGVKRDTDQRLADAWAAGGSGSTPSSSSSLWMCRTPEKALPGASPVDSRQVDALNGWTRRLFERLEQLAHDRGRALEGIEMSRSSELQAISVGELQVEEPLGNDAWASDVLDLLFMAPGVSFASSSIKQLDMPKMEDAGQDDDDAEEEDVEVEDEDASRAETSTASSALESAAQSSAALMRALKELRRVDAILQGVSDFWANMDGTVQKLADMKEHAEILVNYTASSVLLKERFEQRLTEYRSFWTVLEKLCRRYCSDHQRTASRMRNFVRELSDTADLADTAVRTQGLALNAVYRPGSNSG
mmetsp:Transcript_26220/g.47907  ORF Transcript_26220/g.47907 Transcript_26220/m.47907 type:complete len:962 (-) Transcript_26220:167-3052(-)